MAKLSLHTNVNHQVDVRSPLLPEPSMALPERETVGGHSEKWRRMVGLLLLFITVFLWTASNFLASTLFADNTYSKPYLVTYINTALFILPLLPILVRRAYKNPDFRSSWRRHMARYSPVAQHDDDDDDDDDATEDLMKPDSPRVQFAAQAASPALLADDDHMQLQSSQVLSIRSIRSVVGPPLTMRETARLSLEFCFLWYIANYFVAACLSYTTVASSTILTSTSSIFTLLFGTFFGVEVFTIKKLLGVLASLAGIALISTVDLSGSNDESRGSFPHKTVRQIALGDAMALVSAVLYGAYAVMMKKRIGDERRISMPLFFGLVGVFNVLLLWPGFIVLHFTGVEEFVLPPTGRVTAIILLNSLSSLISDIAWAYAVLLTSPIVVTVGLSMTIPLSLIGQIVLNSQHSGIVYWLGACVVVLSFVFVNHEEAKDEKVLDVAADNDDSDAEYGVVVSQA
ncbi:hypothetical protein MBLNU459_g3273t1 [Dothideomycetes sp. NU459]